MSLVELTDILVTLLRNSLPSPHASGSWIYSDYPRWDATFPRISVTQSSGVIEKTGIGEWGSQQRTHLYLLTYEIDIWVKVNDRAVINTETYVGTKLRDKYADLILETLCESKEKLREKKIIDVEITGVASLPLDEEHMLHRKTITVTLTLEKEVL